MGDASTVDELIVPGNPGNITHVGGIYDHTAYVVASDYWSDMTHVDTEVFADGRAPDGVNGVISGVPETIYLRDFQRSARAAISAS